MIRQLIGLFLLASIAFSCKDDDDSIVIALDAQKTYTFEIEIEGLWTAQMHPVDFPENAGFSPFIGVAHQGNNALFAYHQQAETTFANYVETGNTVGMEQKLKQDATAGRIGGYGISESMPSDSTVTFEIQTKGRYNLLSLAGRVNPSPDWFVGVSNINLHGLGYGVGSQLRYFVELYDAGTKGGTTYTDTGASTSASISYKTGAPVTGLDGAVAKFALLRVTVIKVEDPTAKE